jgi:two-component system nitrogen regulation response regulator NtrX
MNDPRGKGTILVIDDEDSVRRALSQILEDEGYQVLAAASGEAGAEQAVAQSPDAIFLDVWLPGIDGLEVLRTIRERGVQAPVIMISGHGTIETAVRATKLGAYDFIEKPLSLDRVLLVTSNALRQARLERKNRALRTELRREAEYSGRSESVERLRAQLALATDGEPILLYGEKGAGRRLAARSLALHGPRPDGPFLDVQASALPRDRLIRTLFGDPSRRSDEPGRVALTDDGTLYIENADNLPATVQVALIEGLSSGRYPVPGSGHTIESDAHLIIALLDPPDRAVSAGKLSEQFVQAFPHQIQIPPLRARREDIPELAERFLTELSREYAREELSFSPEAMHHLLSYDWPGNVRELQRTCERLVLLAAGPLIRSDELPPQITGREAGDGDMQETLRRFEETWLRRHLQEVGGDTARAAVRLGISEQELKDRMQRFGL